MEKKPRLAHLHIIQQQYLAFSGISCSAIFEQLILNMSKKLNLVGQRDYQVMTAFKLISSKLDRRKTRLQCERFFQVKFITGFQFGQAPIPPRPRHWLGKKTDIHTKGTVCLLFTQQFPISFDRNLRFDHRQSVTICPRR